ncbi:MAG: alpha/beta fold hydrolase [Planctomycetaceae bacterium]|nr:alpha/beta fold hydrolase [Planctomycetaceae bacterium]
MCTAILPVLLFPLFAGPIGEVTYEPYALVSAGGDTIEARIGRIQVPEQHGQPTGKQIVLAFLHLPSTASEPGPPIYFLIGGPGPSGTAFASEFCTQPEFDLRQYGDVIALDQRGTGLSVPNLTDGPEFAVELPLVEPMTMERVLAAQSNATAQMAAHWRKEGMDLAAFASTQSAHDVHALQRALGHERIVLVGTSYGSHLALEVLRHHGEHVERALLAHVEGPDDTFKLPSTGQSVLRALDRRVAADPRFADSMPSLLSTLERLLAQLAKRPVVAAVPQRAGAPIEIALGPYDLAWVVADTLGDSRGQAFLPALLEGAGRGDWSAVGHFALRLRRVDAQNGMGLLMDCASFASAERRARIESEAQDPKNLLGDALNAPFHLGFCVATGVPPLPESFREPFRSDVPVLFVSGELDARTPPQNADALRAHFPRSAHLVLTNTAHDGREREEAEVLGRLHRFLAGETVADARLELSERPLAPPRR